MHLGSIYGRSFSCFPLHQYAKTFAGIAIAPEVLAHEFRGRWSGLTFTRSQQTFSLKVHIVNTVGFVAPPVSVGTCALCHCSVKTAGDKGETKECACVCVNKTLFIRLGSAGGGRDEEFLFNGNRVSA